MAMIHQEFQLLIIRVREGKAMSGNGAINLSISCHLFEGQVDEKLPPSRF